MSAALCAVVFIDRHGSFPLGKCTLSIFGSQEQAVCRGDEPGSVDGDAAIRIGTHLADNGCGAYAGGMEGFEKLGSCLAIDGYQ